MKFWCFPIVLASLWFLLVRRSVVSSSLNFLPNDYFPPLLVWTGKRNQIITCQGRCGDNYKISPCACSSICIIQGNCCEGFDEDCPHIRGNLSSPLLAMVSSEVVCNSFNVLVVTSCPGRSSPAVSQYAPVTDTTYNLTFLNSETLACNLGMNKPGIPWALSVSMVSHRTPKHSQIVNDFLNLTSPMYQPLQEVRDRLYGSLCYPEIISSCPSTGAPDTMLKTLEQTSLMPNISNQSQSSINLTNAVQEMITTTQGFLLNKTDAVDSHLLCGNFTSYVLDLPIDSSATVFSNRFCHQCNMGLTFEPLGVALRHPQLTERSVKATLISTNNSIIFQVMKDYARTNSWCKASCQVEISDADTAETALGYLHHRSEPTSCNLISCCDNYNLQPDGECRTLGDLSIGMSDDGNPFTRQELRNLPRFLECVAKRAFHADVTMTNPFEIASSPGWVARSQGWVGEQKQLFYRANFIGLVIMPGEAVIQPLPEDFESLSQHAIYLHALKLLREAHQSKKKTPSQNTTINENVEVLSAFPLEVYTDIQSPFETLRGPVLDPRLSTNSTLNITPQTVAVCFGDSVPIKLLGCWLDQLRTRDVKMIEKMLLNDSCLKIMREEEDDDSVTVTSSADVTNFASIAIVLTAISTLHIQGLL